MKNKFILLILIFNIFFVGCSNTKPLNQRLVINGIGIDLDIQTNKYLVTLQTLDFENKNSQKEPSVKVIELEGDSITDALNKLHKESGFEPLYSQNTIIIFGQEAAQNGINKILDFFIRNYETRLNVKICVAKGEASRLLKIKSNDKTVKAESISDIIDKNLNSDLIHFTRDLFCDISDSFLPIFTVSDSNQKIVFDSIGIFSDGKLSKILDKDDSKTILLLKGIKNLNYIISCDESQNINVKIKESSSSINFDIIDNIPTFDIKIKIKTEISELGNPLSNIIDSNSKQFLQQIKSNLYEKIKKDCTQTTFNMINSNLDILNFKRCILKKRPKEFQKFIHNDNLEEIIKNAKYNVLFTD